MAGLSVSVDNDYVTNQHPIPGTQHAERRGALVFVAAGRNTAPCETREHDMTARTARTARTTKSTTRRAVAAEQPPVRVVAIAANIDATWHEHEALSDALAADLNGIDGSIQLDAETGEFRWDVQPSGTRSETPELWNSGTTKTLAGAKRAALASMRKADASYGHPFAATGSDDEPTADVVPLAKSARGRNGTTKNGKSVATKTGDPRADKRASKPAAKSASKPAATKPAAKERPSLSTKGLAVVVARKSRVTGTLVHLVNTKAADSTIQPKGEKTWARVCVDHNHADFHMTRSAAWNGASDPSSWCPKCKRAASK